LAYEALSEFEHARSDVETALELARAVGDRPAEWQTLLDLGQLWASRNYSQTGDYFQQALALARTLDDSVAFAQCLNRVGNWHTNIERPHEALRYHQEALAIFRRLSNHQGIAQTYDLLGITSLLGADLVQSATYCQQAIALFRTLHDRQGLVLSLTVLSSSGSSHYIELDTLVSVAASAANSIESGKQAVQIAREIGWQAGEAFALAVSSFGLQAAGQYGEALANSQGALAVAQEIAHRQWICLAHRCLGVHYLDLLALPVAQQHLEQALALAKEIGSLVHAGFAIGHLISTHILRDELASAEAMLTAALPSDQPMQTIVQRLIWQRRAELALAQRDPDLALQIVDRLIASAANMEKRDASAIPYLAYLRGKALTVLQRWAEAEAMLQAALATAHAQEITRLVWRIQLGLGHLYQAQHRPAEAARAFAVARQVIEELAATLPDPDLRDNFVRQATALIPSAKPTTPRQAARQTYGGLTRREREVAVLIAQGKSNRAIAEALILGERTVEGYVANILAKLGFSARTQIAAWAVEKGLTKDDKMTGSQAG
jgi:DNA-binding NarL/FixJ family response regulator